MFTTSSAPNERGNRVSSWANVVARNHTKPVSTSRFWVRRPAERRPDADHTRRTIKASWLTATALMEAVLCPALASADPAHPVPFMDHDGTYRVGKDILPGLYLTRGANDGQVCVWSRLSSVGGGDATNVIDHGQTFGAQYALIAPTDAVFESRGCQAWSIGSRPATPIDPIPKTCIYPLTGCIDPNEPQ